MLPAALLNRRNRCPEPVQRRTLLRPHAVDAAGAGSDRV
jgi:hypothetical protein